MAAMLDGPSWPGAVQSPYPITARVGVSAIATPGLTGFNDTLFQVKNIAIRFQMGAPAEANQSLFRQKSDRIQMCNLLSGAAEFALKPHGDPDLGEEP
jgi:hypothetical protein